MASPLSSLKVLDFTPLLPGPLATMMLADLGADVVRVESPKRPDMARFIPPFDGDVSAWHAVLNRNKRSLALDLKQPEAIEVVKRLVSSGGYDIIIEQFRPGVMDRLGIGYQALRAENPAVIFCAITGYGQTGPLHDRAGHDINFMARSGIPAYSGRRNQGPPPLGIQVADIGGGTFGALVGLLAAVVHRAHTGEGQFVDISMFDLMVAWQTHTISQALISGEVPQPESQELNGGRYYDYYETLDGRWLAVGSIEPKFWQGFCATINRPDLINSGLSLDPAKQAWVKGEVAAVIAGRPLSAWVAIFDPLDLCVDPVLTLSEMLAHPHTEARGLIVNVPRSGGGKPHRQPANPLRFSAGEAQYRHTGTALGADTETIMTALGYTADEQTALRAAGLHG